MGVGAAFIMTATPSILGRDLREPSGLLRVVSYSEAPGRGSLSGFSVLGFGISITLLCAFLWWKLRSPHPMLHLRYFLHARFGTLSILVMHLAAIIASVIARCRNFLPKPACRQPQSTRWPITCFARIRLSTTGISGHSGRS
jgi:hypothetical protein